MDLYGLEEMVRERPEAADEALSDLVASADVEALAQIVHGTRAHELRLRAIDALADVGGEDANAILTDLLEAANHRLVLGGTEQRLEQGERRSHLVRSLARLHRRSAPSSDSEEEVAEFVSQCRSAPA